MEERGHERKEIPATGERLALKIKGLGTCTFGQCLAVRRVFGGGSFGRVRTGVCDCLPGGVYVGEFDFVIAQAAVLVRTTKRAHCPENAEQQSEVKYDASRRARLILSGAVQRRSDIVHLDQADLKKTVQFHIDSRSERTCKRCARPEASK